MKFLVEYSLAYDHTVRVGVEAADAAEAEEKAQAAFDAGTIWDDTPEMPLLYDEYEEQNDNTLTFFALECPGGEFPLRDASVDSEQGRTQAVVLARMLAEAYARGGANGGSVAWEDLDDCHAAALKVLDLMSIPRPQAPDEDEAKAA